MANSSVVTIQMKMKSVETLDTGVDAVATDPTQTHEYGDSNVTLNASSTPVATQTWSETMALSGGAKTIDLTALVVGDCLLTAIDMTGEKVQAWHLKNTGSNAMTFKPGVSNPYDFLGDENGQVTLGPGGTLEQRYETEYLEDVDATHKTIDITGTGSEEFEIMLVSG